MIGKAGRKKSERQEGRMELFDLADIATKKELKEYIAKNSLFSRRRAGAILFEADFFQTTFHVQAEIVRNKVYGFILTMDEEKYSYSQMTDRMLIIKEKISEAWGEAESDNTNHLDENNISVVFRSDSLSLSIVCRSDGNNDRSYAAIGLHRNAATGGKERKSLPDPVRLLWILSFVGGIVWGTLMFLSFGEYSWKSFAIWMGGGLLFGVAFAFFFGLSMRGFGRERKIKKGRFLKIKENFSLGEDRELIEGISSYIPNKTGSVPKAATYPSLLEIRENEVTMYAVIGKKPVCLKQSLKKTYGQLLMGGILFQEGEEFYSFYCKDRSQRVRIEEKLSDVIDEEEYRLLFSRLKEATIEYNPYSLYNTHREDVLDDSIGLFTKMLLVCDEPTEQKTFDLIVRAFDHDEYFAHSLTEVYFNVFKSIKEE